MDLQPHTDQLLVHNSECLLAKIKSFRVKDMRYVLTVLREQHEETATRSQIFLPRYGMTLGEFCVFYLMKS